MLLSVSVSISVNKSSKAPHLLSRHASPPSSCWLDSWQHSTPKKVTTRHITAVTTVIMLHITRLNTIQRMAMELMVIMQVNMVIITVLTMATKTTGPTATTLIMAIRSTMTMLQQLVITVIMVIMITVTAMACGPGIGGTGTRSTMPTTRNWRPIRRHMITDPTVQTTATTESGEVTVRSEN